MKTDRNLQIDIMRGIAIILMVYGHTFGFAREFVYLFHMPVFYMISGYCWNNRCIQSYDTTSSYIFNKIIRLLLPYFICNIVFLILNNLFMNIGFITDSQEFLEAMENAVNPQRAFVHLNTRDVIVNIYKVFCFRYIPQLCSPTWFLNVLFYVFVIHVFFAYYIEKIELDNLRYGIWIVIFTIALMASYYVSEQMPNISDVFALRHLRAIPGYAMFLLGMGLKRFSQRFKYPVALFLISFIGLAYFQKIGTIELSRCEIVNPIFLLLCSMLGWLLLMSTSQVVLSTKIGESLTFVGQNTLPILFMHLTVFRIISLCYVQVNRLPMYMVASSPVIFNTPELVKIIYTIAGVTIPLLVNSSFWKCIGYLKRVLHKI